MYDVIIIGGGLYGSSTAFHLLTQEPGLRICIVEPDPTFAHAASVRSHGGVRVLFSQEESIRMSQYGHSFYRNFAELMKTDGEPATLQLYPYGYLLMARTAEQAADLQSNHELQRKWADDVVLLDAPALSARFPSLNTQDITLAVHSPGDMWIDPHGATTGLRRKALSLGAEHRIEHVTGISIEHGRVRDVVLSGGDRLRADWVVNTTGAWAPQVCAMIGLQIPVSPLPLSGYYFEVQAALEQFGMTLEVNGVSFRPEGAGFITLNRCRDRLGTFCWEPDLNLFETENWPQLAARVPAFEAIRMRRAYCCHYALNTFDGNLLLGAWPGYAENFLIATGASGHGLQHAPAAGRGLSEWILTGRYQTLDLGRFGSARVVENRPDPERGFVA